MKKWCLAWSIVLLFGITGCQTSQPAQNSKESTEVVEKQASNVHPTAVIEMRGGKAIELELYPEKAPNTVANFITLAEAGFYNNLTFHRVISGFMIQGGDPNGNGTGGPDYTIKGEFSTNGFSQNDLKHERGVISMARSGNPNSGGSQFFIMHKTTKALDGQYAAFGKVIQGLEVVDEIAQTPVDNEKPVTEQVIQSITIDKKGETFTVEKQAKTA